MTTTPSIDSSAPNARDYIGTYHVKQMLGEGAFGVVYQAYQPFLDRQVAIKVLHSELATAPNVDQQFMHEARTIARLRHPNIVSVYEFGTLPPSPRPMTYMVMEYLPGETLLTRLTRGRLPVTDVVRIIEQLAAGLDYAHARSVIHRDLKPANILFTEQDQPVIVDFGLAKLVELRRAVPAAVPAGAAPTSGDQTASTGTPAYMSPEQVMGKPTGPQSDQYSLALIAYEMLSGHQAYAEDANKYDVVRQITRRLDELPVPVQTYAPEIPTAVNAVLSRALAIDPSNRYAAVSDFAREFGDALLPDRRRAKVQIVSDPVQAALLKASRQAILVGLWGIVGFTLLLVLYLSALLLRGYDSSDFIFVWDGMLLARTPAETRQFAVTGFWPDSVAQQAGLRVGDITTFNLTDDYYKVDRDYSINGVPRSALPPNWKPSVTDTISYTVIRDGQPVQVSYKLARSSYKLVFLAEALAPIAVEFLLVILLLRRWGAEPGMQIFTLVYMAGVVALIAVALIDVAYGLIPVALFILFPAFIHFILAFPEPVRFMERASRRVWWIYVPLAFGMFQFMTGHPVLISGIEANLILYVIYAVLLIAAIILKWGRRDLKRYPGLWGIVAIIIASVFASIAATIILNFNAPTIMSVFGNGVSHVTIGYGLIFFSILVGTILGAIGYHLVQRQLGYSLVTQISQRGSSATATQEMGLVGSEPKA